VSFWFTVGPSSACMTSPQTKESLVVPAPRCVQDRGLQHVPSQSQKGPVPSTAVHLGGIPGYLQGLESFHCVPPLLPASPCIAPLGMVTWGFLHTSMKPPSTNVSFSAEPFPVARRPVFTTSKILDFLLSAEGGIWSEGQLLLLPGATVTCAFQPRGTWV
jgi:hypothetical protein